MAYCHHVAEGPRPVVSVVEDVGFPDCIGAYWGEINTTVHKGLGLSGRERRSVVLSAKRRLLQLDSMSEICQERMGTGETSFAFQPLNSESLAMFKHGTILVASLVLGFSLARQSTATSEPLSTACALGRELTFAEQAAFLAVGRTYRVFFMDGASSEHFFMKVTTPGAFQGNGFPRDVCGANVELDLLEGGKAHGVLTFTAADPNAEHRLHEYSVKITGEPESRLVFSTQGTGIIWGYVWMTAREGFFVGADEARW